MKRGMRGQLLLVVLIVVVLLSACLPASTPQPTSTPTVDSGATREAENVQATKEAQLTADVQSTTAVQQTEEARTQATGTAEAAVQTLTAGKTATQAAEATAVVLQSTEVAAAMLKQVQSLKDQGFIKNTEGTYHQLGNFDESWAQLRWYQWWVTDFSPDNFVITTDAAWETASKTADWNASGCGFVFHAKNNDNHIMIFLAMDGHVYMSQFHNGYFGRLGSGYYGPLKIPADQAKLTLAVENGWVTFLVNDKKVLRTQDTANLSGDLGLTLNSGTNKDWGTRCQMRNIELWVMP